MRTAMNVRRKLVVPSMLLAIASIAAAASPGLEPESLAGARYVSDAQVSPDGRRIVYVVTRVDMERDGYDADLWLIDGERPARPLVAAPGNDTRPRWSPDGGQLAFISSRAGKPQLHILPMAGGEAWALTSEKGGVGAFAWSPDGTRIAYLARGADPEEKPGTAGRARVTERLFFRSDGSAGFVPETQPRLYVIDVRSQAVSLGPLTDGTAFLEPSAPAWVAGGRALIFSATPADDRSQIYGDAELYRVSLDSGHAVTPLTDRRGPDGSPVVSRSGAIAWTGFDSREPARSSSTTHLFVMQSDGAGRRQLTAELDRNVGETLNTDSAAPRSTGTSLAFAADGRSLLFVAADRGRAHLYRAGVSGGAPQVLSSELRGDLRELSVARNGRIAAIFGSPTSPYEVWSLERTGGKWRQLTSHGLEGLSAYAALPYEEFSVASFDGKPIQAWLVKPRDFDAASKYPLILYIHGGPHTLYGESFFHELQLLASAGYVVLISNPRGSTGYGEEFANIIQYRYPGDDYRDLMAAVDAVVARGFIDERRMGVAGGSGGGLLTAWTVAQTPRFAAALVERPVTNWHSFASGSDRHAFFVRHWFRDYPWKDSADYLARSPLTYVDKVTTPVLVIQSEQDYRTPMDQGLQYYGALRMLGKPTRLALFPSSAHGLSREGPPSQ
ncbi:MAG TPA: S9 family peptidase, partial [Steroidobacteraceae bacterium]|nr:S9 family peptidase [Steroidobacteraceae bacterium]